MLLRLDLVPAASASSDIFFVGIPQQKTVQPVKGYTVLYDSLLLYALIALDRAAKADFRTL